MVDAPFIYTYPMEAPLEAAVPQTNTQDIQPGHHAPDASDLTWKERVYNLGSKFKNILSSAKSDVSESEHRVAVAGWGITALGMQALDRFRVTLLVVPEVATQVMEHTHNSVYTGLATGVTFGVVQGLVSESFGQGLTRFPKAKEAFYDSFPNLVDTFTDAVPGVSRRGTQGFETKNNLSLRERIQLYRKMGQTSIGIGSTIFAGATAINQYEPDEARKVYLTATAAGSVLAVGVGSLVSETLMKLAEHGQLDTANFIQDNIIGSTKFWLGIAAVTMAAEYYASRHPDEPEYVPYVLRADLGEKINTPVSLLVLAGIAKSARREVSSNKLSTSDVRSAIAEKAIELLGKKIARSGVMQKATTAA